MSLLRRIDPAAVYFLLLWLLLMAGGRERLFRDPGTFWHVRTGEIILDTGTFLSHDPYTFTFGGRPWTPYEWLGEVGMAGVHRAAGVDGLLLVSATTLAVSFALLFARVHRTGLHWLPAGCVVGLGMAAAASHFHARPHLLTILFLLLTYLRLLDFDAGRTRLAGLLWLVPLFVVWTNTHGGVLGGLGTVGLAVGGWLLAAAVGWPGPVDGRRSAARLAGWGLLVAVTPLATPYGLSLPETWLDIMRMTELPAIIKEHSPVNPAEPSSWPFFALGAVYLVALAGLRERPRVTWLLPLVWFALGCERVRHAPLFAVTAVAALADFFPRTVWAARLAGRPDLYAPAAEAPRTGWHGWALAAGVVLASAALQLGGVRRPVVGCGWARFPESEWPIGLLPDLHREAGGRAGVPIFNEYEYGGFLIYFAPEYRPFVDDRCEVFGGPWLAEFVAASRGDAAPAMRKWEATYPRWDLALTRPGTGFDRYFSADPGWERVAAVSAGRLYRRKP